MYQTHGLNTRMLPYYHPIDLQLDTDDWRFLNFLSYRYLPEVKHFTFGDIEFRNYEDFFLRDTQEDYRTHNIFRKISELFTNDSPYSNVEHVYHWSQISTVPKDLPAHVDVRKAVISIPLITFTAPVIWYDENDVELHRYHYENAVTLINTEIRHGSPENLTRRIFFQVGGFKEPIETIVSQLKLRKSIQ